MKKITVILIIFIIITIIIYLVKKNGLKKIKIPYKMKYFNIKEFDSGATQKDIENGVKTYTNNKGKVKVLGSARYGMNPSFLKKIDNARALINNWNTNNPDKQIIFVINSGLRLENYNKQEGGVKNSAHILGRAADIKWSGYSNEQKIEMLKALYEVGFRRFGIGNSFVHVDNANEKTGHNTPTVWTYGQSNPLVTKISQIKSLINS